MNLDSKTELSFSALSEDVYEPKEIQYWKVNYHDVKSWI